MNIGYIGTGAMGRPMIARLTEAYPNRVWIYDVDAELAATVSRETGAVTCGSVTEIAGKVDVLFTCVPNNQIVHDLYLGEDGVVSAIRPGTITIDCSTVGPDATRDVYAGLKSAGAHHLDASMLGSVLQAETGTISFVVGGDADAFDAAKPVLAACGQMIRHCGPSGAGNQMKLVHQTLVAGHAVAVAEALGLCLETGTDIDQFFDIVTGGTGFAYSRYFENRVPRMCDGEFGALFMLKFMLKDARLARGMSDKVAGTFPLLEAAISTLEEGDESGYGDDDFSAAMKVIQDRLNLQL